MVCHAHELLIAHALIYDPLSSRPTPPLPPPSFRTPWINSARSAPSTEVGCHCWGRLREKRLVETVFAGTRRQGITGVTEYVLWCSKVTASPPPPPPARTLLARSALFLILGQKNMRMRVCAMAHARLRARAPACKTLVLYGSNQTGGGGWIKEIATL